MLRGLRFYAKGHKKDFSVRGLDFMVTRLPPNPTLILKSFDAWCVAHLMYECPNPHSPKTYPRRESTWHPYNFISHLAAPGLRSHEVKRASIAWQVRFRIGLRDDGLRQGHPNFVPQCALTMARMSSLSRIVWGRVGCKYTRLCRNHAMTF